MDLATSSTSRAKGGACGVSSLSILVLMRLCR